MPLTYTTDTTPFDNNGYHGAVNKADKITCLECGKRYHQLAVHVAKAHGSNIATYNEAFPGAPTVSAYSSAQISAAQSKTAKPVTPSIIVSSVVAKAAVAAAPALTVVGEDSTVTGKTVIDTLNINGVTLNVYGGLTPAQQAKVPEHDTNYNLDLDIAGLIAAGIALHENILITGPTGSGKTTAVKTIAALANHTVTRINLNGDTRAADLIGDYSVVIDPDTGKAITEWQDGPLIKAMIDGDIILLDEIDAASPSVHFVLQAVTERHHDPAAAIAAGKPHAALTLPTGRVVGAHPHFRIIATANTVGTGDMTGDYAATNILNQAFLDRFGIKMRVEYPDAAAWKAIILAKTGVNATTAKHIVEVAQKVNEGKAQGLCRAIMSPRKTLTWARVAKMLGTATAAKVSIINGIDPVDPDAQFIKDIILSVTGVSV